MRRLAIAVLVGLLITLTLGLLPNQTIYGEFPNIRVTFEPMLGVGHGGYPLPWMRMIVYPGSLLDIVWQNFVADVVIWTLVTYALIIIIPARMPYVKYLFHSFSSLECVESMLLFWKRGRIELDQRSCILSRRHWTCLSSFSSGLKIQRYYSTGSRSRELSHSTPFSVNNPYSCGIAVSLSGIQAGGDANLARASSTQWEKHIYRWQMISLVSGILRLLWK